MPGLPTDIADRLRLMIDWRGRHQGQTHLMSCALAEIERLRAGRNDEAELRATAIAATEARVKAEGERDALREQLAASEVRIDKAKSAWKKVKAERDALEQQLIAADPRRNEVPV